MDYILLAIINYFLGIFCGYLLLKQQVKKVPTKKALTGFDFPALEGICLSLETLPNKWETRRCMNYVMVLYPKFDEKSLTTIHVRGWYLYLHELQSAVLHHGSTSIQLSVRDSKRLRTSVTKYRDRINKQLQTKAKEQIEQELSQ